MTKQNTALENLARGLEAKLADNSVAPFARLAEEALRFKREDLLPLGARILAALEGHDPDFSLLDAQASVFGETSLTLFRSERFFIQALVWFNSTTTIHDHGFEGAFLVLTGGGVQTEFTFAETETLSDNFSTGRLTRTQVEMLNPGDTSTIVPGDGFIHNVLHSGFPSITLVVRTYTAQANRIADQHNYYKSGLRWKVTDPDALAVKRYEYLRTRITSQETDFNPMPILLTTLQNSTFDSVAALLIRLVESGLLELDLLNQISDSGRSRFGASFVALHECLRSILNERRILNFRNQATDGEIRRIAALMSAWDGDSAVDAAVVARSFAQPEERTKFFVLFSLLRSRSHSAIGDAVRSQIGLFGPTTASQIDAICGEYAPLL